MIIRDVCPRCKTPKYKKDGHIYNGKQNHQCKGCGRQFVECFEQYLVSDETRGLIERLLLERLALRRICRVVGVGLKWLLGLIVNCFEALPDHLNVQPITRNADVIIQRVEVEADEMASFVQQKANKQWIWLTMAAKSHQTIDFHVGDRSRDERPAGSPLAASAGSRVSPVAVERLREIAEVEFADIVVEA